MPWSSAEFLTDLEAIHGFLNVHKSSSAALREKFKQVEAMQVSSVKSKMSGIINIDMLGVTQIIEKIQDGPWSDSAREDLVAAASGLSEKSSTTKRSSLQTFNPQTYIPEYLHTLLDDKGTQMRTKMYHLGQFLPALGVHHPSEPTVQKLCAYLLVAHDGASAALSMNPCAKYSMVVDFKRMLKSVTSKATMSQYINTYPPDATDFAKLYPAMFSSAYTSGPPKASAFAESDVAMVANTIPMRKTKSELQGRSAMPSVASSGASSSNSFEQVASQFMMQMARCMMPQFEPNVRMLPPRRQGAALQGNILMPSEAVPPSGNGLQLQMLQPPLPLPSPASGSSEVHGATDEAHAQRQGMPHLGGLPLATPPQSSAMPAISASRAGISVEAITDELLGAMSAKRQKLDPPTVSKRPSRNMDTKMPKMPTDNKPQKPTDNKPKMPTDNSPTNYLSGVVYVMPMQRQWRVYVQKGSKKDFKLKWGPSEESKLKAWNTALSRIQSGA